MYYSAEAISNARRADRAHDGITYDARRRQNKDVTERIGHHLAPDPVRDSSFIGGHGTKVVPSSMYRAYTFSPEAGGPDWDMQEFLGWHQLISLVLQRGRLPYGRQMAWGKRYNVRVPEAIPYGSRYEFPGVG